MYVHVHVDRQMYLCILDCFAAPSTSYSVDVHIHNIHFQDLNLSL